MAAATRENSSVFNRVAVIVLMVLYKLLTLQQFMNYAFYKLKHAIRYLGERNSKELFRGIQQKPEHLALVFAESCISFPEVAKLISWCSEADIRYVTLYDPRGILKTSAIELLQAIEKLALGRFKVKIHFSSPNGHQEMASINNVHNEVHVHLAAAEDGRGAIVKAARRLHEDQTGITMGNVDSLLRVTCDWPEPDLLIRCGGLSSHLGFLPWALRLTEFADLYSHHLLFPSEFKDILTTFSRTDRRRGR